jgi:hypothetical protein
VAALAAAPLKFQQLVVNSLMEGGDIHRVAWLCASILGTVLISAALKFVLNYDRGPWFRAGRSLRILLGRHCASSGEDTHNAKTRAIEVP